MKTILLFLSVLITFVSVDLISTKECYGESAKIQRLKQEIKSLSEGAIAADRSNNRKEFNRLSREIKKRRAELSRLGQKVEFDADEDRNGCVDAGEANMYELITGRKYTGPKPMCGPDMPSW